MFQLLLSYSDFKAHTPQTRSSGVLDVLTKSLREEGPMFIFKGWTPAFIRLAPNTVLLFVFLEVCVFDITLRVILCLLAEPLQQLKKAWHVTFPKH